MYDYYYIIGPEAFGIQTIYRGGGEEHRSEIAWQEVYDLGSELQPEAATPEYPEVAADNVGESIDFSFFTGKEDVKVWLSSQLRVENGQNVPDLVSIDVTPTEEGEG